MSRWFRMHDKILDDPKVQCLPAEDFRAWVNLLCLTSRSGGKIPDEEHCCFALRMKREDVSSLFQRLLNGGLIEKRNGGPNGYHYAPHKWEENQYKSDTSTERVKRFRERQETLFETPPEAETETEIEDKEDKPPCPSPQREPTGEAVRLWNEAANAIGWPSVTRLSDGRRSSLRARLRGEKLEGWIAALARARASPLLGRDPPTWFTFDWLIKAANFTKLMDGNYDRARSHSAGNGSSAWGAARDRNRVRPDRGGEPILEQHARPR